MYIVIAKGEPTARNFYSAFPFATSNIHHGCETWTRKQLGGDLYFQFAGERSQRSSQQKGLSGKTLHLPEVLLPDLVNIDTYCKHDSTQASRVCFSSTGVRAVVLNSC